MLNLNIFGRTSVSVLNQISTTNRTWELIGTPGVDAITIRNGLTAGTGGTNRISTGEGADVLTITGPLTSANVNDIDLGNGVNTLIVRGVIAQAGGENTVTTGSGTDTFTITGNLEAAGTNTFDMGDGVNVLTVSKDMIASGSNSVIGGSGGDKVTIAGKMQSSGLNEIDLGDGINVFTAAKGVFAQDGGTNRISAGGGKDVFTISGNVESSGLNEFNLGEGNNVATFAKGLNALSGGTNMVEFGAGNDVLTIAGKMQSAGVNHVDLGDGNNVVTVALGMQANGGTNQLITGDGNDVVTITGPITANDGVNYVSTGDGNDVITITGPIQAGALVLDTGGGHDVLVLNAANVSAFNSNYKSWLTSMSGDDLGVDSIRIGLTSGQSNSAALSWVSELSDLGPSLEMNLDGAGRNLKLGSYFKSGQDDIYDTVSLSGSKVNSLTVKGSLSDNGVDADSLRINGDSMDTVVLSRDWSLEQRNFADSGLNYEVYTNNDGDSLMVQMELNVTFGG